MSPLPVSSVWVCTKCGAFYTVNDFADEGTEPCDDCGSKLVLVGQSDDGVVTLDQVNAALKRGLK